MRTGLDKACPDLEGMTKLGGSGWQGGIAEWLQTRHRPSQIRSKILNHVPVPANEPQGYIRVFV